jgi:predicted outer membrane repeat protein
MVDGRIVGNMALWGGGIRFENESPAVFVNCLIYGNFAEVEGGGVYAGDVCFPAFLNCSISANSAIEQGGGVYCELMTQPSWTNCIEWGNTPGSLWMNLSHCLTEEDPHFLNKGVFDFTRFRMVEIAGSTYSLPDFVVVEPDYHLLSGSLAIDRGFEEGAPMRDIEGNERPCGGGFDIGAYEYCPGLEKSYLRGDGNGDGGMDIGDVTFVIGFLFLGGSAFPSCEKSADTDDNGNIEISDAICLLSFLFLDGPSPGQPFPTCGPDPTIDGLTCDSFGGCVEP